MITIAGTAIATKVTHSHDNSIGLYQKVGDRAWKVGRLSDLINGTALHDNTSNAQLIIIMF